MTKMGDTLKRMQLDVEALVAQEVPHGREPLYTNNQNRQMMIRYEVFRQTAYAMIGDGSVQLAVEMMTRVANELRAYERAAADKARAIDPTSFRKRWTEAFSFEKQGWFIDMDEIGEIDEGGAFDWRQIIGARDAVIEGVAGRRPLSDLF